MNLENRTVLITGANRGIGRALVEEALKRGAKRVYAGTRSPFHHSDKRVTPLTLDVTTVVHWAFARRNACVVEWAAWDLLQTLLVRRSLVVKFNQDHGHVFRNRIEGLPTIFSSGRSAYL